MEFQIDQLHKELEIIRREAKKKFTLHEKREEEWVNRKSDR
jgi:hypothetical protein